MSMLSDNTLPQAEPAFGDAGLLAVRLGSADGLTALGREVADQYSHRVADLPSLRTFLRGYHARILVPRELPAICQAFGHASRYEVRELLELDRQLAGEALLKDFAFASRAIGRNYLRRLRPLRDQRLVQRYLQAIQCGHAHGWHTLVYGVVLSVYSLPLRQGLISYGRQTLASFIESAARRLGLAAEQRDQLRQEIGSDLPAAVERLMVSLGGPRLL